MTTENFAEAAAGVLNRKVAAINDEREEKWYKDEQEEAEWEAKYGELPANNLKRVKEKGPLFYKIRRNQSEKRGALDVLYGILDQYREAYYLKLAAIGEQERLIERLQNGEGDYGNLTVAARLEQLADARRELDRLTVDDEGRDEQYRYLRCDLSEIPLDRLRRDVQSLEISIEVTDREYHRDRDEEYFYNRRSRVEEQEKRYGKDFTMSDWLAMRKKKREEANEKLAAARAEQTDA